MSTLDVEVPPRADAVPEVTQCVASFGARSGLGPRGCFELRVVVAEALNNVVQHALAGRSGRGAIALHCERGIDAVTVTIVDDGQPIRELPGADLPDGRVENGRGWPIIHRWTDGVEYRSTPGRNALTLTKRLPGPGDHAA